MYIYILIQLFLITQNKQNKKKDNKEKSSCVERAMKSFIEICFEWSHIAATSNELFYFFLMYGSQNVFYNPNLYK